MSLQQLVGETFAPDGLLSQKIDTFLPRAGQTKMACAVARTIENGGCLVVEAGTGIGKTFSYLVPVLLSGSRVLVSTATKTLQDQLFRRDIPQLVKVLDLPVRVAMLKGRSNYLCAHRMGIARQDVNFPDGTAIQTLARIELWAQSTRTGDLAELPGLGERSPVIPFVTSSHDNCLGATCPQIRGCHVNLARREALAADVVVVNHHLFFADLAVRDSGMAELLPIVQTVVFDEAHQLNETGVQFLGKQLTTGQLLDFSRDLMTLGLIYARGLADWNTLSAELAHAARDLRLIVGVSFPGAKLSWVNESPEQIDRIEWMEALSSLHSAANLIRLALEPVAEIGPELMRMSERIQDFMYRIDFFSGPCHADSVRWLDVGTQLRLVEAPLDIANAVQSQIVTSKDDEATRRRSWIFTSATLGGGDRLRWFTEPCGLSDAEVLIVDSPFDYSLQAAVYVPMHLPKPSDPSHSEQVAEFVARSASAIGGRTLLLTTTLRALKIISESLLLYMTSKTIEILVQGQQPKTELIEQFRHANQSGRSGCILVASASFWEGVDLPGDVLQLLVMDKLPFPPPNDPVVEARSKRLESAGRSVFNAYFMPEAALALKQGAGRLIRHESDRGILVVCDTRLSSMGYGKRLLATLPEMRKIDSEEDFFAELDILTRPSTKDPSWL